MYGLEHEYRFLRRLGAGSEGEVWLAEDLRRDRLFVSWKHLRGGDAWLPEEFLKLRGISHPLIAPVLESGSLAEGLVDPEGEPVGGGKWFTSPYFPGQPLDRLPSPLDPVLLEGICHQACRAIVALNDHDLRHGDLKPAHFLWSGPHPLRLRVIDLGHASLLSSPVVEQAGTPPYAAPELWEKGATPNRNSDLYALAMSILQVMRGGPVIRGASLADWHRWHRKGDRDLALTDLGVEVSRRLIDAIRACLSPDPADRPRDAAALLHRLEPWPDLEESLESPTPEAAPLIGREDWMRRSTRALLDRDAPHSALILSGPRGAGRTRLLRALAARVAMAGGIAVESNANEPVHDRIFSALSLRAPHRVLFIDDVGQEDFPVLVEGWRRIRAIPRSPAPQLVVALAGNVSAGAAPQLQEALARVAGPIRIERVPGLDLPAFRELAHHVWDARTPTFDSETRDLDRSSGDSSGRDPAELETSELEVAQPDEGGHSSRGLDVDRRWREGGGLPATLFPRGPETRTDFATAESALGPLLAGWLAEIPTSVPWSVLTRAADLSGDELWRRIAEGGPHAPSIVGTASERRVLPWAAPRELMRTRELDRLAQEWRSRDGVTGEWSALYLLARSGKKISPEKWRAAVDDARLREDFTAVLSLSEVAPDRVEGRWLSYEARSRSGENLRVRPLLPEDPTDLTAGQCRIASMIIELVDGPEKALPFARARIERSHGSERDEARIAAARLAQNAGNGDLISELLADPIDRETLAALSLLQLGTLQVRQGHREESESTLRLALDRGRGGAQPTVVAGALSALSGIARQRGDLPLATRRIERAIRYARLAGIEAERPVLAINQGALLHSLRRTDAALAAYRRAARFVDQYPDGYLAASAQLGIGTVLRDRGDLFTAMIALRRAIRFAREVTAAPVLATALGNLGDLELLLGSPLRSAVHREELLSIAERIGDPALVRQARIALAAAVLRAGNRERATELLDAADGDPGAGGLRLAAWAHWVRAECAAVGPERKAAMVFAAHAIRDALRSGRSYTAAAAIGLLARLVHERGRPGDAVRSGKLLDRGLDLARLDPAPPLSRIPLEIEKCRLAPSSEKSRERAAHLAWESLQIGLVEEFFCAIDAIGSPLPDDIAEVVAERRPRLLRRYGPAGIELLEQRRAITVRANEESAVRIAAPATRPPRESAPRFRALAPLLDELLAETRGSGARVLTRPARAWRTLLEVGAAPRPPEPPTEPFETVRRTIDGTDQWWIGLDGLPPAAVVLSGLSAPFPAPVVDRAELSAAIAVHFHRNEAERAREKARKLREELRSLRARSEREQQDLATRVLTQRLDGLSNEGDTRTSLETPWIVESKAMQALDSQVDRWARSKLPILLWGESGTGKTELLSRLSRQVEGPFITENCAALPEALLEVELFGSVPGAFTGADREHAGLLARSSGGTLVLDHLDELPPPLQAKLLRVLDSGQFRPLGAEEEQTADFRLAATLRDDPNDLIERGALRPELYYRLQGLEVFVPPLRERREEIEPLLDLYLRLSAKLQARSIPTIHPDALRRLIESPWPGNVRELINATQRWLIESRTMVRPEDVSPTTAPPSSIEPTTSDSWSGDDWKTETDRFHTRLLRAALERHEGNQTHAAKALGISRRHLQNLLNKLGFRPEKPPPRREQ